MDKKSISFLTHELRNPLAANQLYLEMLQKGVAGNLTEKQKEMIQELVNSNEKMLTILRDFKDMFAD
jgi:signal transduction histidine kinase